MHATRRDARNTRNFNTNISLLRKLALIETPHNEACFIIGMIHFDHFHVSFQFINRPIDAQESFNDQVIVIAALNSEINLISTVYFQNMVIHVVSKQIKCTL